MHWRGRLIAWVAVSTLCIVGSRVLLRTLGAEVSAAQTEATADSGGPAAPSPPPAVVQRAPDFTGADSWLNTDKPISMKDLRGQVVLLDFWTYCCVNCMHIFPDLHYIEQKYTDQPVAVIGVHSGKFDEEKDLDHIRQAILRHNIAHPVAVDSELKIWNAYSVPGWPTLVLIDAEGNIVQMWSGEGHRDQVDQRIAELLKQGSDKGILAKPLRFREERASFKSGALEFPGKVLADGSRSRLFISDTNHNRVLVADLNGKVGQIIGDGNTGLKNGDFHSAEFRQPQGLALSADGRILYVADTENHAIRTIDLEHQTVATLAGTGEQARQYPHGEPADRTALSSPWDLICLNDKLYIAMAGVHQIWVLDLKAKTVGVFAGSGREGDVDGLPAAAGFAQPSGLATDGTRLYVADSEASSIRAVLLGADRSTHTIAGSGQLFGFGRRDGNGKDATFQHPLGVAVQGDTLWVADTFNGSIRQVDLKTNAVSTFLASDAPASAAGAANLYEPGGISIDGNSLYVADTNHHRIVVFDIPSKKSTVLSIQLP